MTSGLAVATPRHLPAQRTLSLVLPRWVQVVSHIDPRYGGLSAAVPALGRRVAASGHFDVSLAAFCSSEEHFQPAGYSGGEISFWPAGHADWLPLARNRARRRALTESLRGAQGVHIHGLWEASTAAAARAGRELVTPYIVSPHGMLEPWALRTRRLKKLIYSALVERRTIAGAACLHALTRAEADHLVRFGARSPIAIIPNGVDIPERKDPALFFRQYPELAGKRILLYLGRLHPKKGIDLLLQAWAALSHQPDAHLVLAGPDSDSTRAALEAFVQANNLQNNVSFTGMLRGEIKWSALAAAEGFILPSHSEGLSVAVLEAMGMGLPVIVTEPCNMPEVSTYDTGWHIPVTLAAITAAVSDFFSQNQTANLETGCRGACLVAEKYSWPVIAQQMVELYRWIAGGRLPESVDLLFPA